MLEGCEQTNWAMFALNLGRILTYQQNKITCLLDHLPLILHVF